MHRFLFLFIFCVGLAGPLHAQKINKDDYFYIDILIKRYGALSGSSVQYIADSITRECKTELEMTRAFYRFLAVNVSFDLKRFRHSEQAADNASTALMERKAGSQGFALLFDALCEVKKIDCRVVKGVWRHRVKDIGKFDEDLVHYWNIVTINNTQYLIDASLAWSTPDEKHKHLISEWTDAWWLCNRKLFSCSHFPDDKNDQLLEAPISKAQFSQSPVVCIGAIVAGLVPTTTVKGLLRGKADSTSLLKFNIAGRLSFSGVQVSFDNGPREEVKLNMDDFGFYIMMPHGPAGKHVAEVFIKNKLAYVFKTDMKRGRKIKR